METLAVATLQFGAGNTRTFSYRPGSAGDNGVMRQIFQAVDYDLAHFVRHKALYGYLSARTAAGRRPLVIDAGANIGASPVFFALQFPTSRVIAIEPEKGNLDLMRLNCVGLDVIILEGAIGAEQGIGYLSDPGHGDWGFRVGPSGNYRVPLLTIPGIIGDCGSTEFFPLLCKIDIEGGESALFAKNTDWVDLFPLIIVELHDWLFPGEANSRNFLRAIASYDFDFVYRGENVFCFNNRLLKSF